MIKSELNTECGKRLKECLQEFPMTQNRLAELTGYSQQYISNIVVGKKPMTVKAAKLFAEHLHVREEYLLDEDDKKTVTEMFKKRKNLFDQLNEITTALLNLAGFKPICNFIENWKELGLDRTIYGPFTEGDTPGMHTDPDLDGKIKFSTEIQTPNGKKFYCDTEDFELLEYEILEYIKFRMTQLESKYAWKYDDGAIFPKCKGSEVYIYPEPGKNISENPDYLENSIWVNHDDDFFPDISVWEKKQKTNISSE